MKKLFLLLIIFVVWLPAGELTPEMVMNKVMITGAKMNPDGEWVAYSTYSYAQADSNERAKKELFALNRKTGEVRQFTFLPLEMGSYSWSENGKYLYIQGKISDMNKTSQIYRVPLGGGGFEPVSHIGKSFYNWRFSPDEKSIFFLHRDKKDDFTPLHNDADKRFAGLYVYDIANGNCRKLSPDSLHVWGYAVMPDGKSVVIRATKDAGVDYRYMFQQLYLIDVASSGVKNLVKWRGKMGSVVPSPDGRYLAVTGGVDISDPTQGSLFLIDMKAPLSRKNLTENFQGTVMNMAWTDDDELAVVVTVNAHREIWSVDIEGDGELEYNLGHLSTSYLSFDKEKKYFATTAAAYNHPYELFYGRVGKDLKRLTFSNPEFEKINFSKPEEISWMSRDGKTKIYGVLYKPLNYKKGGKYPLQMMVHGGPESADVLGWNNWYSKWPQIMAQKGAFVLMPNYRGSTGRGVAYAKADQKDMMGREFEDMLDGIDYLIKNYGVDPERVGVSGGSYGGYTAAWAATKYSERFAASVMFVGISDQISKFGTTDTPYEAAFVHWDMWPYEDNFELFWERSPLKYAAYCKTPILIASGEKDERVPPEQGRELYRAIKWYGKAPVEFYVFKGEGHGNRKKGNREFFQKTALDWLDRYLFGK
jgi:dipeptidyl aminopeptidase/acylaminoacyl peptidase